MKREILFFIGSMNQARMMCQIAGWMGDHVCYYTFHSRESTRDLLVRKGFLNYDAIRDRARQQDLLNYMKDHNLKMDPFGRINRYDLVFTCQDLIQVKDRGKARVFLIQEGIIDPETALYQMVRMNIMLQEPSLAWVSQLNDSYDYFFVGSDGYRDLFALKGFDPDKMVVTGIPGMDNLRHYHVNEFSHRGYILAVTSDRRDTLNPEKRKYFIQKVLSIAGGRPVIFKLHPNENRERALRSIRKYAPEATVYMDIDLNPMVANCEALVTVNSPAIYTALALGKEVHAELSMDMMQRLTPIQNGGTSARCIADFSEEFLCDDPGFSMLQTIREFKYA